MSALVLASACTMGAPDTSERVESLGGGKVVVCHVPPGNPANAHTIEVGSPAVPAHLAHGDHLDECGQECALEGAACTTDADCCVGSCNAGLCHQVCAPGEVRPCYDGDSVYAGVGACTFGTETCNSSGTAWGACAGAIAPSTDVCGDGVDNDCNGTTDNAGADELCDGLDNDCDGVVDEGCLGGLAWNDGDMDGAQSAADPGPVAGVTFVLRTHATGAVVSVTTSDEQGLYNFSAVPVGDYVIEAWPPDTSWGFTPKDVTDDALDNDFGWGAGDWGETDLIKYDGSARDDIDCGLWKFINT